MNTLQGKKVTVFGLGTNQGGIGTVQFLSEQGVREIVVTDAKPVEALASAVDALKDIPNIRYVFGGHRTEDFTETDLVIKNPAIRWDNEYILAAQSAKVPVEMDSSLFFQLCPCPIIGVTGTKGKTTTATLLAFLLRSAGQRVVEVGISQAPVLGTLKDVNPDSIVVFELSSWRLSGLRQHRISPHIAVFTNFFPDHLNYYASMEDYFEDKRMICAFQQPEDILILPVGNFHFEGGCGKGLRISCSLKDTGDSSLVFWRGESIIHRVSDGTEQLIFQGPQPEALRGEHNRSNILAATVAAVMSKVSVQDIVAALPKFMGVPHRMELIREWCGIRWYDDTAATIPEATIQALAMFGTEPVILIAGGADKNLDFTSLARVIAKHLPKSIILFRGVATDKLFEALRRECFPVAEIVIVDSMADAVRSARASAVSGDTVLLSPGAASFGLFQNEFDRGEQFRGRVGELLV